MGLRLIVLAIALASACGPTSTPPAALTPSGAATAARAAASQSPQSSGTAEGVLMLNGQGQLGGTTSTRYGLYVIGLDGRISRSVTAGIQSAGWYLPRFSVAGHSVYFLDGDQALKVLRSDGSVSAVAQLPGGAADRVVFAVSPDETRTAYSVIHFSGAGATSTSLRVGNLDGSNIHEIFSGPAIEFPIGWRAGQLVIAVTKAATPQNLGEVNPYWAVAYHIADPVTANRTFSTSPTCDEPSSPTGPVNGAGTVCQQSSGNNQVLLALGWDGSRRELFRAALDGFKNAVPPAVLSPDGQRAAAGIAADHRISLLSGGSALPTAAVGTPAGWFDADHLLFMTAPCCQPLTAAAVLEVSSNTVTPVAAGLAGEADPYAPTFASIPSSLL
jgi:hypothetical protein